MPAHSSKTCTIANGQTVSGAVCIGAAVPLSLQFPASMTGATVTFQGSQDNVTYQQILSGSTAYTETVTSSKDVGLDGGMFAPFIYIKIVSASAESGAKDIVVLCRAAGR